MVSAMNNEKGIISKLNNIIETYTSYLIREVPDGKIFTKTILTLITGTIPLHVIKIV